LCKLNIKLKFFNYFRVRSELYLVREFFFNYASIITRSPPYLIGIMYGLFIEMVENEKKNQNNNLQAFLEKNFKFFMKSLVIVWTIILPVILVLIHQTLNYTTRIYTIEAIVKLPLSVTVGFLIMMCHFGHFKIINELLSLKIWREISKITFAFYLLTPAIQKSLGSVFTFDFDMPLGLFDHTDFWIQSVIQLVSL
jgi:peptidoglycan/LPS O-acetylase OafA/YrhL